MQGKHQTSLPICERTLEKSKTIQSVQHKATLSPTKIANELALLSSGHKQIYNPVLDKWTAEKFSVIPDYFVRAVKVETRLVFSDGSDILICLDLRTNEKTVLPRLQNDRLYFELAVLDEKLYAVGGYDPDLESWTGYVDRFDFTSYQWRRYDPIPTEFSKREFAAAGRYTYVMYGPERWTVDVDRSNFTSKKRWTCDPTPNPQVAVAGKFMFVAGNAINMKCFDFNLSQWSLKPFILGDLRNYGFIGVNGKLYVVGGVCGRKKSNLVYSYDPLRNIWDTETKMRCKLSDTKCTSWKNQLIVYGGYDSRGQFNKIIQKYDTVLRTWTRIISPDHFIGYFSKILLNV